MTTKEQSIDELLINNTLHISTYESNMKNIIIDLDKATQALLALIDSEIVKARIEELTDIWKARPTFGGQFPLKYYNDRIAELNSIKDKEK
jgi:hypothetical protein